MEDHWVTCTVGNSIAKEGMKGLLRTAFSSTGGEITIRPTVVLSADLTNITSTCSIRPA